MPRGSRAVTLDPAQYSAGGRVTLRPALRSDRELALALYLETTQTVFGVLGRYDEQRTRDRFDQVYRRSHSWTIWQQDVRVGWLQLDEAGDLITLRQIHLVEGYRDRGIGAPLLRELLGQAAARGRRVALNTIWTNRAIGLYERLGFVRTAQRGDKVRMHWRPGAIRPTPGRRQSQSLSPPPRPRSGTSCPR